MKKFLKGVVGATVFFSLIFLIMACSTEAPPEQTIKQAMQKMEQIDSFESEIVFDEKMSMGAESDGSKTVIYITSFKQPLKNKTEFTIQNGYSQQSQTSELYIDKIDDVAKIYGNVGGDWYQRTLTEEELQGFLSEGDINRFLNIATNFQKTGTEQVNDKNTTRYDAIIAADAIKDMGEVEMIEAFIENTDLNVEEVYQQIGSVPIKVCIDEKGYIIKFEMDLKDMLQKLIDIAKQKNAAEFEITNDMIIDTMTMTVTYHNINAATNFEIPQQAKEAKRK